MQTLVSTDDRDRFEPYSILAQSYLKPTVGIGFCIARQGNDKWDLIFISIIIIMIVIILVM